MSHHQNVNYSAGCDVTLPKRDLLGLR